MHLQFRGSFDGLRLVLIGDLHEQPLLHVKVKPFILGAKDWSGEVSAIHANDRPLISSSPKLRATSTLALHMSYWNITNSHWEPRTSVLSSKHRMMPHCTCMQTSH